MRRIFTARSALAIALVAGCLSPVANGQGPLPFRKPQGKVLVFQPPAESSAVVGVMGQVRQPGTYQFANPPTLQYVIDAASGFTPTASSTVRIVRGYRVAQRIAYPAAAQEKLQAGDLVIVDSQPAPLGTAAPAAPPAGVQLALLGVIDRPIVVKVHSQEARANLIAQKLGQGPEVMTNLRVIPAPNRELEATVANGPRTAPLNLPDNSVLIFDPRQIQLGELPDDLPKILPCSLPEPDIGAYGIRHAIEERAVNEPHIDRRQPPPAAAPVKSTPIAPLPPPENSRAPTPIAEDGRVPATFSSGERSSTPISRVPFSKSPPSVTRSAPLSAAAPSSPSIARDAQEPAWDRVNSSAAADAEFDAAESQPARGSLSAWQMLTVLSSAGLLIALALVVRAGQDKADAAKTTSPQKREHRRSSNSSPEYVHSPAHASVPVPHIPFQGILKPGVLIATGSEPMANETLDVRQQRFDQLIKNQLPLIEEPLALRPGLHIALSEEQPTIWRADAGTGATFHPHGPLVRPAVETPATAGPRQIIDAAHPHSVPQPHHRVGVEAPVERALRQLQGGAK